MDTQARRAALLQAADDQVRAAQLVLASKLRQLANAAQDAAAELVVASPHDLITSHVPGRYAALREAIVVLNAAKAGAAKMREEATSYDQQRSA